MTCAGFFCLGSHFVLFPTLTVKVFGMKSGGTVYAVILVVKSASSYMGVLLVNIFSGAGGTSSQIYWGVFITGAVFSFISLLLVSIGFTEELILLDKAEDSEKQPLLLEHT